MRERKSAMISGTSSEGDPTIHSFSEDARFCLCDGKLSVIDRPSRDWG